MITNLLTLENVEIGIFLQPSCEKAFFSLKDVYSAMSPEEKFEVLVIVRDAKTYNNEKDSGLIIRPVDYEKFDLAYYPYVWGIHNFIRAVK